MLYDVNGNTITFAYDTSGTTLDTVYDVNGDAISGGTVDYDNYTITPLWSRSPSLGSCQGIEVYGGVLFQFRNDDNVCLFNFENGSDIMLNLTIESDHGDSATFSKEFYAQSDEFPLIYVTADTSPAKIYVNRITRSTASLIKTLTFPLTAGYYGAGAFDWNNNICYLLSYKEQNYQTDDGGANTTVVSKWDLSNLTDNGGGSYTPAFISQYERDFIYVMQGLAYHDGLIWITSGIGNAPSHIYAMEPDTGVIKHTITMDDSTEIEGAQFVYDTALHEYYMVTGQQGGKYKKITFAEATT